MGQQVYQQTFSNGLVLLAEEMPHVRSAAINFLIPAGSAYEQLGHYGIASVLSEMIMRGAGERDSRALSLALDALGLDRDTSVGALNMRFWGSTLARNIPAALELYADILRCPHLPPEELEPAQALALQDLQSLEDSPQHKVMVELRSRYYPPPLCQDRRGKADDIQRLTPEAIRQYYLRHFRPNGAILSVAGNIEWGSLKQQVDRLFGDWNPGEPIEITPKPHVPKSAHIEKDTQQTQIALAFPSVPVGDPYYYAARATEGVLSGGMSARLFTEVREKRGLCYSIGVRHETFKDRGTMVGYAGTGSDRAQQTLDVTISELRRLRLGVTLDEIQRVKAGLKSSLIMQDESTSARAGAIASDWYFLGRVRSYEEIQAAIESLEPATVVNYLEAYPIRDITLVTVGPEPLELPEAS